MYAATEPAGNLSNLAAGEVVLDDVTPCYAAAGRTLRACRAALDAALQALLGSLSVARSPAFRETIVSHKSV